MRMARVGTALAVLALVERWSRRFGVDDEEVRRPLAGDDVIPSATVRFDRAITIDAPAERVWPWVAQLGQDRAGFYSFEALENLVGCDIHGRREIVPSWRERRVGDPFPLHPRIVLRIAAVDVGRSLVVGSVESAASARAPMPFDFGWTFNVIARADGGSRLHVRELYNPTRAHDRIMTRLTGVVSALMSWRMLRTIRRLAQDTGLFGGAERVTTGS